MTRLLNASGEISLSVDIDGVNVTERKIRSFGEIEAGWHYGEGVPFVAGVLEKAIELNAEAVSKLFLQTDAFPGVDGEVMVTVYSGKHYLEFTIEKDGSVTFAREEGNNQVCYEAGLAFGEAKNRIGELRKEICKSYGSSTDNTTISENSVLKALPSRIVATAEAFQLSILTASPSQEEASVNTFAYSTPPLPENLQFSGVSEPQSYLLLPA